MGHPTKIRPASPPTKKPEFPQVHSLKGRMQIKRNQRNKPKTEVQFQILFNKNEWIKTPFPAEARVLALKKPELPKPNYRILQVIPVRLSYDFKSRKKVKSYHLSWKKKEEPTHLWMIGNGFSTQIVRRNEKEENFFDFGSIVLHRGYRPKIHFLAQGYPLMPFSFRLFPSFFMKNKDYMEWLVEGETFIPPFALQAGLFSLQGIRGNFRLKEQGKAYSSDQEDWEVELVPFFRFEGILRALETGRPLANWRLTAITASKHLLQGTSDDQGRVWLGSSPDKAKKLGWDQLASFQLSSPQGFTFPLGKRLLTSTKKPMIFKIPSLGQMKLILEQTGQTSVPSSLRIHIQAISGKGKDQGSRILTKKLKSGECTIEDLPAGRYRLKIVPVGRSIFLNVPPHVVIPPGTTRTLKISIKKAWTLHVAYKSSSKDLLKSLNPQRMRLFLDPEGSLRINPITNLTYFRKPEEDTRNMPNSLFKLPIFLSKPFSFQQNNGLASFHIPTKPGTYSLQTQIKIQGSLRTNIVMTWKGIRITKKESFFKAELPGFGSLHLRSIPLISGSYPLFVSFLRKDGMVFPSMIGYALKGFPLGGNSELVFPQFPTGQWKVFIKTGLNSSLGSIQGLQFSIHPGKRKNLLIDFKRLGWMPVRGRIVDEKGGNLGESYLHFYRSSSISWPGSDQVLNLTTDKLGNFYFPIFPPGRYDLSINPKKSPNLLLSPKALIHPTLGRKKPQEFPFPSRTSILILDSSGKPKSDILCNIRIKGRSFFSSTKTNSKGKVMEASLPPLSFELICQDPAGHKRTFLIPTYQKRKKQLVLVWK